MPASSRSSAAGSVASSPRSRSRSAFSVSAWELTETYSPAAIDMAPSASPAAPARRIVAVGALPAATPTIRLAVETMPSLAPSTAARSQPIRETRCRSRCKRHMARRLAGQLDHVEQRFLRGGDFQPEMVVADAGQDTDLIVGRHRGAQRWRAAGIAVPGLVLRAGGAQINPRAVLRIKKAAGALGAGELPEHEAAMDVTDGAAEPVLVDHVGRNAAQLHLAAAPVAK